MTDMTVLATQIYSAGAHSIAPTLIPDSITSLGIAVLRCTSADTTIWPNATDTISYDLQVSLDGGQTYQDLVSGSGPGGISANKLGQEVPTMNIQGDLPAGTNRFFIGTVTLSADIKTGATVTVA